jgi:transcriptional regulator with PAS, ATPase and Fis domain
MAASNSDLLNLVGKRLFRNDLYYRLNVAQIRIPPLRERKEEIPGFVMIFLLKFNEKYNQNKQINKHAIDTLASYDWPGNIRELENTIERLAITCHDEVITSDFLMGPAAGQFNPGIEKELPYQLEENGDNLKRALDSLEKEMISAAYRRAGCTRKAALLLGINQSTVVKKMKKHGVK